MAPQNPLGIKASIPANQSTAGGSPLHDFPVHFVPHGTMNGGRHPPILKGGWPPSSEGPVKPWVPACSCRSKPADNSCRARLLLLAGSIATLSSPEWHGMDAQPSLSPICRPQQTLRAQQRVIALFFAGKVTLCVLEKPQGSIYILTTRHKSVDHAHEQARHSVLAPADAADCFTT